MPDIAEAVNAKLQNSNGLYVKIHPVEIRILVADEKESVFYCWDAFCSCADYRAGPGSEWLV